jgi:hypothetical protein
LLELGAKHVFNKSTDLVKFLRVLEGSHRIREFPAKTKARARTRAGPAGKLRQKPTNKGWP